MDLFGINKNLTKVSQDIEEANKTWQETSQHVDDVIKDVHDTCEDVRKKAKVLVWLDAVKTVGVVGTALAAVAILLEMRK